MIEPDPMRSNQITNDLQISMHEIVHVKARFTCHFRMGLPVTSRPFACCSGEVHLERCMCCQQLLETWPACEYQCCAARHRAQVQGILLLVRGVVRFPVLQD